MLIRSQATGANTVPAVSTVICRPASRRPMASSTISGAIIGSPPVTTTCLAPYPRTSDRIDSTERSAPSGLQDVYGVSHHVQRRLQPLVRTNTDGTPTNDPSPWTEWKISAMRIRDRVRETRFSKALQTKPAAIAQAAGFSRQRGIVATARQSKIHAQIGCQPHDLALA